MFCTFAKTKNLATALLLAVALSVHAGKAQGRGPGGPPGGGPGGPGGPGGGRMPMGNPPPAPRNDNAPGNTTTDASGRTLQLGPVGRWWDDTRYAKSLGIDASQQKRMDQVFGANRDQLLTLYTSLKHEESLLAKANKSTASEADLDAQIDRVSAARNELQKANTHMLLQIRKELTAEQVAKLDAGAAH